MEKILVVEDELPVRQNLEELLTFEGYECTSAQNGLEALNYLENYKPDLIISDIAMPYVDGYQLYDRVKSTYNSNLIPFIFLTAKIDKESQRKGMNMGVDDYITKPYSIDDLLTSVKTRIEKKKSIEKSVEELRTSIAMYVPHELRTPLVSILGYSDLMISDFEMLNTQQLLEMLGDIKKSGLRLHERIEKFVLYAKLKTAIATDFNENIESKISINIASIECEKQLKTCHDCLDRLNDIEIDIEEAYLPICEEDLKIIASELISNSCKFSEPGTKIKISGKNQDSAYILKFSDSGFGIPILVQEQIQAFEQFDREKYQQVGNGLGLAIVKLLCEKYGISLNIESVANNFTTISLTFNNLKHTTN